MAMASSSLTSSLSSVLNQQHCMKIPNKCSVLSLRFFSLKPHNFLPAADPRIFSRRRTLGRSSASALSHRFSRSFSQSRSQSPVSSGSKFSDIPSLHNFMPKATAAITDAGVSDPQLDLVSSSDVVPRGRIYHETYGCQMNVNDMEIVLSIMKKAGYSELVEVPESAEIIFINTCAIRDNAEQKVWQRLNYFWFLKRHWKSNVAIGRSQSLHPPKVVVLGCMAERLKEKILDADKMVDVVCGPDAYRDLPRLLDEVDSGQKGINTLLSWKKPMLT
ncbi:UNVERIFIED_CONTAM: CDK5RAP1-like protein [Sesamum radiatum]|uniref:CDK5RAP1-like protein n=1 Tax=Sesamum radiatum TaxID=300843 RepID=A0AAW2P3U3_SESRA